MDLSLSTETNGLSVTVNAARIDAQAALKFKDAIHDALTSHDASRIILNLAQVNFIDPSGLGAIVSIKKHMGSNRQIDLCALNPAVDKVFRLTRMDSIFSIHPDLDSALRVG
jgi:anti-sigma B factor antagonist